MMEELSTNCEIMKKLDTGYTMMSMKKISSENTRSFREYLSFDVVLMLFFLVTPTCADVCWRVDLSEFAWDWSIFVESALELTFSISVRH